MKSLRPLLKLEEKVASESRRLAVVGHPPSRRAAWVAWGVAFGLHAAVLAVPLARTTMEASGRTPRPELPLVLRVTPPRPQDPVPVAPSSSGLVVPTDGAGVASPGRFDAEPVPEPTLFVAGPLVSIEIEAMIPAPDAAFEGFEPVLAPRQVETTEPVLRRSIKPTYPAAARALGASGSVTLEVTVREDGTVGFARVLTCTRTGLGFEAQALLAVREWLYHQAPAGTGPRGVTAKIDFKRDESRP